MNLTFLRLSHYMYEENPGFLGEEWVFGKFAIRKEIGEKEMSKKGKKSKRRPSLFYKLYEPYLFTPIPLYI
jgi:hypothetical protein